MLLDLSSFRSTKDFTAAFKEKNIPLHILINNAGIAWLPLSEFIVSVCHMFCFTKHNLPLMQSHRDIFFINIHSPSQEYGIELFIHCIVNSNYDQ